MGKAKKGKLFGFLKSKKSLGLSMSKFINVVTP